MSAFSAGAARTAPNRRVRIYGAILLSAIFVYYLGAGLGLYGLHSHPK